MEGVDSGQPPFCNFVARLTQVIGTKRKYAGDWPLWRSEAGESHPLIRTTRPSIAGSRRNHPAFSANVHDSPLSRTGMSDSAATPATPAPPPAGLAARVRSA